MERWGDDPERANEDGETGTMDAGGPGRDDPGRERDEVPKRGDATRGKPGMMTRRRGNDDEVTG